jgi:hypothetical protein
MSVAEHSAVSPDWAGEAQQVVSPRLDGAAAALVMRGGPGKEDLLFNVGGTVYKINRENIDRWPTTLLAELMLKFDGGQLKGTRLDGFDQNPPQPMYLDRHPVAFSGIAKFYETKGAKLDQPWDVSKEAWMSELRFFRVIGLGPTADAVEAAQLVLKHIGRPKSGHRRAMWDFLENPSSSRLAKAFMIIGLLVIMLSILSLCLDTVYVLPHQAEIFRNLEAACILFFTVEYAMRLYATNGKLRFVKSRMNIIDLVAILPYYVGLLLKDGVDGLSVVRVVRLVRVFRVFKFGSSMRGLTVFTNTMVNSLDALLLLLFFVMLAILLFGSVIFFAERDAMRFDRPLADGSPRPRFCDHAAWDGCPACSGDTLPQCGGRQADIVDDKLVDGAYDGTRATCEAVAGCRFVAAVEASCTGEPSNHHADAENCHDEFVAREGPRSACVPGCTFVEAVSEHCITEFEWHLASETYALLPEETRLVQLQAHAVHGAQCPAGEQFNASLPPPWAYHGNGHGDPIFSSIPMGFWWTLCTMTSLGYGEIYPVTYVGRVVGGLASLAGLITLALPMVIIGQNFSDAYRVQMMAEGVAADAEEALIARKEARAKMKFEKQFRKIRQGGAGAAGAAGLMAFRARKLKVATSQPAGGGASLNTPRSRSASPNADALEATLFPKPPAKAHGETQAEQQMQDADNLSAAGIADSLYMTPEQEAASQAAGVTPALVPTPPPPRE